MFFRNATNGSNADTGYYYIPVVERPKNLEEACQGGYLWLCLRTDNCLRLFYTALPQVPRDKNNVAICFKVKLTEEEINALTVHSAGVYCGALAFQPEDIESCILIQDKSSLEYERIKANEAHGQSVKLM